MCQTNPQLGLLLLVSLLLYKNQNDIDLNIVGTTHPGEYAGKAGHAALSSVGHDPDQLGAVVGRVDLPVATSSSSSSSSSLSSKWSWLLPEVGIPSRQDKVHRGLCRPHRVYREPIVVRTPWVGPDWLWGCGEDFAQDWWRWRWSIVCPRPVVRRIPWVWWWVGVGWFSMVAQ